MLESHCAWPSSGVRESIAHCHFACRRSVRPSARSWRSTWACRGTGRTSASTIAPLRTGGSTAPRLHDGMWHMALPFSPTLGVALRAAQDHRHFLAFGSIPSRVCGPAWIEDEQRRSVARRSLNYTPRFAAEGRNEHVRLHRVKRGPGPRCWRRRWNKERGNLGGSIGSHHAAVPAHADERPRARPEPLRAGADGGGMGDAFERGVYGDIAPGESGKSAALRRASRPVAVRGPCAMGVPRPGDRYERLVGS